ncbi:hypothetical protein BDR26DRAFT_922546 [Obelidium mucronatum]|nr:hypothetical protein BDR26DRAFT_922546 [Obelidium mucronatum]
MSVGKLPPIKVHKWQLSLLTKMVARFATNLVQVYARSTMLRSPKFKRTQGNKTGGTFGQPTAPTAPQLQPVTNNSDFEAGEETGSRCTKCKSTPPRLRSNKVKHSSASTRKATALRR